MSGNPDTECPLGSCWTSRSSGPSSPTIIERRHSNSLSNVRRSSLINSRRCCCSRNISNRSSPACSALRVLCRTVHTRYSVVRVAIRLLPARLRAIQYVKRSPFGGPATSLLERSPWLCAPASQRVCRCHGDTNCILDIILLPGEALPSEHPTPPGSRRTLRRRARALCGFVSASGGRGQGAGLLLPSRPSCGFWRKAP